MNALLLAVALAAAPSSADRGVFRGDGVVGVWMGFHGMGWSASTPSAAWMVFYQDGQVFDFLPDGGLAWFDRAASQKGPDGGNWGRIAWKGSRGSLKKRDLADPIPVERKGPKQIQVSLDRFVRCAEVDGLKLDGTWSSLAPDDPDLARMPKGATPAIHFTRDGRFTDHGLFVNVIRTDDDAGRNGPGEGTYQIRDFSLLLRYSDGRARALAFTGMGQIDPAKDASTIYLARFELRKRTR